MPLVISKNDKARKGEALAQDHLIQQGLKIIEKNWRHAWGEVDLIARSQDGGLIFVEVKSRWADEESAWDAFHAKKREKLRRLALAYLKSAGLPLETALRFDAVLVDLKTGAVDHHPHAYILDAEL